MLTEEEPYAAIEETWARGVTAIDTLYQLVKAVLAARLKAWGELIGAAGRLQTLPPEMTDELLDTMYDLLIICRNQ